MKKEILRGIGLGVGITGAFFLAESAFSFAVRREIGERDHWTCQYPTCDDGTGQPKSFQRGWMVFASHLVTHNKAGENYNKPSSGKIHCIEHEITIHRQLLHIAQQHHDADGIRFNVAALNKLAQVDWRTTDYRKHPNKYNGKH